jgi:hypothetical protein
MARKRWIEMQDKYNITCRPRTNWKIWIGDYNRQQWPPHLARAVLTITKENTRETSFALAITDPP